MLLAKRARDQLQCSIFSMVSIILTGPWVSIELTLVARSYALLVQE